jgi:hypothetical protein
MASMPQMFGISTFSMGAFVHIIPIYSSTNFSFSYFDQSVLEFMRKFQQNSLLDNVRLVIDDELKKDIVQPVLTHLLPLVNGILSIEFSDSAQLVDIYKARKDKEIYERNMEMMEKTRFLGDR